jgi:hypothetical protein
VWCWDFRLRHIWPTWPFLGITTMTSGASPVTPPNKATKLARLEAGRNVGFVEATQLTVELFAVWTTAASPGGSVDAVRMSGSGLGCLRKRSLGYHATHPSANTHISRSAALGPLAARVVKG